MAALGVIVARRGSTEKTPRASAGPRYRPPGKRLRPCVRSAAQRSSCSKARRGFVPTSQALYLPRSSGCRGGGGGNNRVSAAAQGSCWGCWRGKDAGAALVLPLLLLLPPAASRRFRDVHWDCPRRGCAQRPSHCLPLAPSAYLNSHHLRWPRHMG